MRDAERWTLYLSLSTAIIAVFAAIAALQSSANESHVLVGASGVVFFLKRFELLGG